MAGTIGQSLGELLLEKGIIDKKALEEAVAIQKKNGKRLGKILQDKGYLDESILYGFLEGQLGVKFLNEIPGDKNASVFDSIPYSYCKSKMIAPVLLPSSRIRVYVSEPTNTALINEISFMTGRTVEVDFATEAAISEYLTSFSASDHPTLKNEKEKEAQAEQAAQQQDPSNEDVSPVVKFVTEVILHAIERHVSDIHFEVYEKEARLRFRIDGVLHTQEAPDIKMYPALISRIKILAELDISEKRLPQDGRIMFNFFNRPIDIRVSIVPTVFGENAVLRILDKGKSLLSVDDLGMGDRLTNIIKKEAKKPHGMILVTGPTGSGKTTSLYAVLSHIKTQFDSKILTIEDPVEYQIQGISQVQVHADIGLTFAAGLRSFLRHDPDVIMVGEIRDKETADIAVRSALTGHLVLSTVHTNDSASTITRFIDMGIPAYLLTSTINLIVTQRLVRRICPECKGDHKLTQTEIEGFSVSDTFKPGDIIQLGKGCKICNGTGYQGRLPIFEWIQITDPIKKAVLRGESSFEIREIARNEGMPSLRDFGLAMVKAGLSTLEEVEKIVTLGE